MRLKFLTRICIAIAVAVGSAAVAAPARAAETVDWYPFSGFTAKWHCGDWIPGTNHRAKPCVVVSSTNYQAALVVDFMPPELPPGQISLWYPEAYATNVHSGSYGDWRRCKSVNNMTQNVIKVCFAPTVAGSAGHFVQGYFNGPGYNQDGSMKYYYSPSVRLG